MWIHRPIASTLIVGASTLAACELTLELGSVPEAGELGDELATSTGDPDTGESESSSSSDELGSSSGSGELDTDTRAELDETDTSSTDTSAAADTGGELCEIDGSEPLCEICTEQLCCAELTSCVADEGCECMNECIEQGTEAETCAMSCAPGLAYFEFVQCQAMQCAAVCL